MHLDLSTLDAGLPRIKAAPADGGTVELIVRRPVEDEREILTEARLDPALGMVGDRWSTVDADHDDRMLTLMNARLVDLVATSRERWPLAGDQLYVDLDLSTANLPVGTRLGLGSAVAEVTSAPHRGCKKFAARFGLDALRFVNNEEAYALRLRGMYVRVLQGGVVRAGDVIRKLPAA
jgi:MOSC domain-containing protein YiiM